MRAAHRDALGTSGRESDRLYRKDDLRAVLLSMAGQDLRQPIEVLQSTYEMLDLHLEGGSGRTQLARGLRAILRLSKQLDHLVDAMQLHEQTSDIVLAPVPIQPVVVAVIEDFLELAVSRSIEVRSCPTSAVVISNEVVLQGIVRNLIHNAIKYTPSGRRVLIGCRRRRDEVCIDICDTGPGMSPEQIPRAFEAFNRLDTSSSDGLGLGLYVVRRAAALLSHRIEVHSRLGRGSRFSIVAPVPFN